MSQNHDEVLGRILYSGSVKNVRAFGGVESEELTFEFTDRYSVFDWGVMPQLIPEKGQALAVIGAVLFERLAQPSLWQTFFAAVPADHFTRVSKDPALARVSANLRERGLLTHYRGLITADGQRVASWKELQTPPSAMIVRKLEIQSPTRTETGYVYDRRPSPRAVLVPLEVVFRHRLTEGSSILERRSDLRPGMSFAEPLIETFTKLEPRDRFLTPAEAREVSGLAAEQLAELSYLTQLTAQILRQWFADEQLELVDGKLEWAITPDGEFLLVDAIGPDELRVETRDGIEISKEVFRRFYRTTEWYAAVKAVKSEIDRSGEAVEDWQIRVTIPVPPVPERILHAFAGCLHALSARLAKRDFFGSARLEKHSQNLSAGPAPLKNGRVLLIGNGGREHALAWKILQSPQVKSLAWYPGSEVAASRLASEFGKEVIRASDLKHDASAVAAYALREKIDLVVIGPDQFLADGWTDILVQQGLTVFGPTKGAARIEWSKSFSKEVLRAADVPTAASYIASTREEFGQRLRELSWDGGQKWVFKADGLALGKGVKICGNVAEAREFGEFWLNQGHPVLVEEFLEGEELSWFAFADGETCALFDAARDYKTLNEGGQGPNTGGMGAISPVPGYGEVWEKKIREQVMLPVLREMKSRGVPYHGLLYAGLMINGDRFWVLEFNARFGDPETQVLLPRMKGDLIPWLVASARGGLVELPARVPFEDNFGAYVVVASPGYPEKPKTGFPIVGIPASQVFLGSVVRQGSDLVTSGGRVLGLLGLGTTADEARNSAMAAAAEVKFAGAHYRRDIGGWSSRARIVVLASGRGSNFEALARATQDLSFPGEIVALLSNRPDAPALEKARTLKTATVETVKNDGELLAKLQALNPDVIVLAGYMKILPSIVIEAFRLPNGKSRILNVHPSLLPKLPGMHSYRRAFEAHLPQTGVTVHEVEAAVDAGPILAQTAFSIAEFRSVEEVENAGLAIEHRLYPAAIRKWILENRRPHAETV